jgi:hypothetical protein
MSTSSAPNKITLPDHVVPKFSVVVSELANAMTDELLYHSLQTPSYVDQKDTGHSVSLPSIFLGLIQRTVPFSTIENAKLSIRFEWMSGEFHIVRYQPFLLISSQSKINVHFFPVLQLSMQGTEYSDVDCRKVMFKFVQDLITTLSMTHYSAILQRFVFNRPLGVDVDSFYVDTVKEMQKAFYNIVPASQEEDPQQEQERN